MSDQSNQPPRGMPTIIPLSPSTSIDLSYLGEDVQKALLLDHSKGLLDLAKKANELNIDQQALRVTLENLARVASDVAQSGGSATISHTTQTSTSRTEVLIGNSDAARGGRLTKSATGERDWNPLYVLAAIAAVVIIALAFAK